MNTHIVTLHNEPVVRIIDERGKANVHTGSRQSAIRYTEAEAVDVAAWIGRGAAVEKINLTESRYSD